MEVLHCAGLDVHKETVVACMRHMVDGTVKREVRTFDTTTTGLLMLADWLASESCTAVAMEATGVYWKPVWHILSDGDFTLVLPNADTSRTCWAARPTARFVSEPCGRRSSGRPAAFRHPLQNLSRDGARREQDGPLARLRCWPQERFRSGLQLLGRPQGGKHHLG
jgi:Transposase